MRLSIIILAVVSILGCGQKEKAGPAKIEVPAEWFTYYTPLQEALAADDFETARAAVKALLEHSAGEVANLVKPATEAADIASLRTAFKPFSEALKELSLPEGLVVAYCPMAFNDTGAHWVQKDGTLMNPYFGAEMLHCGMFKRGKKDGQ